jgi:hypothetical protein
MLGSNPLNSGTNQVTVGLGFAQTVEVWQFRSCA